MALEILKAIIVELVALLFNNYLGNQMHNPRPQEVPSHAVGRSGEPDQHARAQPATEANPVPYAEPYKTPYVEHARVVLPPARGSERVAAEMSALNAQAELVLHQRDVQGACALRLRFAHATPALSMPLLASQAARDVEAHAASLRRLCPYLELET